DRVVAELGQDEYQRLVAEVDRRFPTEDELKAFLPSITRQEARDLIYGTVLDTAIEDSVHPRESEVLDWLAALLNVRVAPGHEPDTECRASGPRREHAVQGPVDAERPLGGAHPHRTARTSHSPGTPRSVCFPRSSKARPPPMTTSRTVP